MLNEPDNSCHNSNGKTKLKSGSGNLGKAFKTNLPATNPVPQMGLDGRLFVSW
jgi:hypothetical protein